MQPIGIFDSGFGGLTVLKEIVKTLPQYDYIYMGDNARAPYGPRSYETVYQYTWQCVQWFFKMGSPLVVLACNTASAKALRTIQQNDLQHVDANKRVLGVIRPTTEIIGSFSTTGHVGVLGTQGTVQSMSYPIEIEKFFPEVRVYQEACPLWVPLVENNEFDSPGANYFIQKHINNLMEQSGEIDTILLACTHYPLLKRKIEEYVPANITILSQGEIVATSLKDYLSRHIELEELCSKNSSISFYTTDMAEDFDNHASIFYGQPVKSQHIEL